MPFAADEIDFQVHGDDSQFVEIELDPNESAVAEAGALLCMEDDIEMNTIFGDGSSQEQNSGVLGTLLGAGKRLLTGESLFITVFTNKGSQKRRVYFAAPFPGKIVPMDLGQQGGMLICQRDAFLCAAKGVSIGIAFQKKILAGFFGGEGFILQKLEGDGLTFIHAGGSIFKKELQSNETLRVDTGSVVAFQPSISFDIRMTGGIKSSLFGGEGLFLAELTGPGTVWLQSLPFSHLAAQVISRAGSFGTGSTGNNPLESIANILESR